jgi:hypothetical protein
MACVPVRARRRGKLVATRLDEAGRRSCALLQRNPKVRPRMIEDRARQRFRRRRVRDARHRRALAGLPLEVCGNTNRQCGSAWRPCTGRDLDRSRTDRGLALGISAWAAPSAAARAPQTRVTKSTRACSK